MFKRWIAVLVTLVACKKTAEAPPPLSWIDRDRCGGMTLAIQSAQTCATIASPEAKIALAFEGGEYVLGVNAPDGTVVTSGAQSGKTSSGETILRVRAERLATLSVKDAFGDESLVDPGFSFTIALPSTKELVTKAPPMSLRSGLLELFANVKGAGVKLAGDPPAPGKHTLLFATNATQVVFGPGGTVGEIDWVAVREKIVPAQPNVVRTCRYEGTGGATLRDIPYIGIDEKIAIYDRRTGTLVDSKDFTVAETECKPSVGREDSVEVPIDLAPVLVWLAQRVAQ